jgi:hypothetical protein
MASHPRGGSGRGGLVGEGRDGLVRNQKRAEEEEEEEGEQ